MRTDVQLRNERSRTLGWAAQILQPSRRSILTIRANIDSAAPADAGLARVSSYPLLPNDL